MRLKLYNFMVNRVPSIRKKYHKYRREHQTFFGRIHSWIFLILLNFAWKWKKNKWSTELEFPDFHKKVTDITSESELSLLISPKEFADKLLEYDVISFDIFDTLIFRPFVAPSDLFFVVGEKLGYLDFEHIRRDMEWRARQKVFEQTGTYEVTIEQIYQEIEMQAGIPAKTGIFTEMETELDFCFANPYMKEVFQYLMEKLKGSDKKIICISDMYMPSDFINRMLEKCGFLGIHKVFVSCEESASKYEGKLYKKIMQRLGVEYKYVHIGDHPISDVKHAKKNDWNSIFYQNVNVAGISYRAEDLSIITGSLYRGIINAKLHNGFNKYSFEYELGYVYGGIFVLGYCQFIHKIAKEKNFDKILFLSRDGEILFKVYQQLFLEEVDRVPIEYVFWSRAVATKLTAKYYKYDYLRRFIDHKINQKITLLQIFKSMELIDLLKKMIIELPIFIEKLIISDKVFGINSLAVIEIRKETIITPSTYLTNKNAWIIKEYLISNWDYIIEQYKDCDKAAKQYYTEIVAGFHNVAAIDVGWAGSGALSLDYLFNKEWNLDCNVTGIIAGSNSLHNSEPNAAECFLYTEKLISYLYSQENNRDHWKKHSPEKNHNILVELLVSSVSGSLTGFTIDDTNPKGYKMIFKKPDIKKRVVEDIQTGILDFINDYNRYIPLEYKKKHNISGGDVYAILKILLQSEIKADLEMGI